MPRDEPLPAVSLARTYGVPEGVVFRDVEGETVILDMNNGTYFGLDPVGTRMWQLLIEHARLDAVVTALLAEFEVDPGTLRADLLDLVTALESKQLLRQTG